MKYTSVILVILCTSIVCAIGLQSPKSTGQNSKTKERHSLSKGTKCGISASAPDGSRIIGGEEARPHSWPWQVWFRCMYPERVVFNSSGGFSCGGSIISDKWIITAAHCVDKVNTDIRCDCRVFLGKHELQRNESTQLIAKIATCFVHEKFDPDDKLKSGHDLALCKLAKPVKFTDAIQPICLPFGLPELPVNKSCFATGWGVTKYNNAMPSDKLMQLSMTAIDNKQCPIVGAICAMTWDGNKDVCNGDSGGPLACQEHDRKWYLRGVTSMGAGNCRLGAAFTKVTSFEKWIKNITSRN